MPKLNTSIAPLSSIVGEISTTITINEKLIKDAKVMDEMTNQIIYNCFLQSNSIR